MGGKALEATWGVTTNPVENRLLTSGILTINKGAVFSDTQEKIKSHL
jgi:hypothetical protein